MSAQAARRKFGERRSLNRNTSVESFLTEGSDGLFRGVDDVDSFMDADTSQALKSLNCTSKIRGVDAETIPILSGLLSVSRPY